VFYRNEHVPVYGERIQHRIPTYFKNPPAVQQIAGPKGEPLTDLSKFLDRLTIEPS
jgi:hypothetical protein